MSPFEKKWNLDIIYIGNSITQGVPPGKPEEEATPAKASKYLLHKSGVENVEFINQGRSSYKTVDYLPAGNGALNEVITATRQLYKDANRLLIFTISLGTDNSTEKGPNVMGRLWGEAIHESIIKEAA